MENKSFKSNCRAKNKGTVFIVIGAFLIAAAISLVVFNLASEKKAEKQTLYVTELLCESIPTSENGKTDAPVNEEHLNTETEIPDHILNPEMDMPTVTIDGNEYIGVLEIPALELTLPVLSAWNYPKLNISPCRYTGSAYTDDLVIAAHNYICHFANIPLLNEGAEIHFTDVSGNIFTYSVRLIETVPAAAVEDMTESGFALTLFTCNSTGQARIAVRCDKKD